MDGGQRQLPKLRRSEDKKNDVIQEAGCPQARRLSTSQDRYNDQLPKSDNSHYVFTLRPTTRSKIVADSDALPANPHFSATFCHRASIPEHYSKHPD